MKYLVKTPTNKVDVLVIDQCGSEHIVKCIPEGLSFSILEIRSEIPYINNLMFFLHLCRRITQFGVKNKTIVASIIDVIKPKIIISFIDNSPIMGQLYSIFPQKLVISVQNGLRVESRGFLDKNNDFSLPYFFSFGEYEKDLVQKNSIRYKKIFNIGSLQTGIFLSNYSNNSNNSNNPNSICFISQYWPPSKSKYNEDRLNKIRTTYINLIKWSDKSGFFKIKVAIKHGANEEEFSNEISMYKDNMPVNVELIKQSNFSSYRAAYESLVSITMFSTLGFEMFGLGKKVLFCGMTVSGEFLEKKNISFIFNKMPDIVILKSLDKAEFNSKISNLVNMSNKEYLERTREAREYYMSNKEKYPHEIISKYIKDFILKMNHKKNLNV
ncbi:MAG: hypothetical protein HOB13_12275 [Lentimicrobiaceae bacterium]|nr:hypothetical protein [Lentimicrobiaceae bacterium]